MVAGGIPLGKWSGSDSVDALHETTKQLQKSVDQLTVTVQQQQADSERQASKMIGLTWAITVLTLMMLAAVVAQIVIAIIAP